MTFDPRWIAALAGGLAKSRKCYGSGDAAICLLTPTLNESLLSSLSASFSPVLILSEIYIISQIWIRFIQRQCRGSRPADEYILEGESEELLVK